MKRLVVSLLALVAFLTPVSLARSAAVCTLDAPAQPTSVTMIGWTFPILDYYAGQLKACGQTKNLTVNVQILASADAQEQMRLAFSSPGKSPYDIIHSDNTHIAEFAGQGVLLPLDDLIAKYKTQYKLDDIDKSLFAAGSVGGKVYGIPIIVNTQHLYYNKAILAKARVEVPKTYDDVIKACGVMFPKAKELGIEHPFAMVLSAGWAWEIEWQNLLSAYGGTMLDATNKPIFNSKEGVAAVNKIMDLVKACFGTTGLLMSTDDVQAGIRNGSVAMAHMWASRGNGMDDPKVSEQAGNIEYAPALYPSADIKVRSAIAWADFLAIPARSEVDKDLLFRMIMEAAKPDTQLEAAKFGIPSRSSAVSAAPRNADASLKTIAEGGPANTNPALGLANAALGEYLPKVATGELTAQAALDAAAAKYLTEATAQKLIK